MTTNIDKLIKSQFENTLKGTNFNSLGNLYAGKVRDNYNRGNIRVIIATDRISSFDRVITTVPFKGELLNLISAFWFDKTKNIAPNHLIDVPDPNVSVVQQCETIPVEMIVRGYITGTMWREFQKGNATSGIMPPANIKRNQQFDDLILTPSTKAETGHDIYLPREEILKMGTVDKDLYELMEECALKLFEYGQDFCKKNGLILVDTKYEFGTKDGELMVIDEIHTQDSSRFWLAKTYDELFAKEENPEILDKEMFREFLMETFPDIFPDIKPDQDIPDIPDDIRMEVTKRYMKSYKYITGIDYIPSVGDVKGRIEDNLKKANYL